MNEDDDDLPVLTQILRTGKGAGATAPPTGSPDPADETPSMAADQLVIGHEPPRDLEGDPTAVDVEDAYEPLQHVHLPDSFRLPQDHDGPHGARSPQSTMNEPEFVTMARAVVPPRTDPSAFAVRVREAVLEGLSARIETELDARIAQAIHAEVETSLAQLQLNLREHVTEALHDVVQRAVEEEIARLGPPPNDGA